MKNLALSLSAVAVVGLVSVSVAIAQDDWFDLEGKCAICKHMGEHQELMMEIDWSMHPVEKGMMMVAVIPEKHQATMKEIHKKMEKTIAKLEEGEDMHLCGFCKSYGGIKQAGAKIEEIETKAGIQITLVTADRPELIEMIHKHAKKSMAEKEKMMKALSGDK